MFKFNIKTILILLPFLIFACSSSPDVMDTAIDKQKEMDAQYKQAQDESKAKSDADAKAKSDADAKAKSDADAKTKSDADAKAKPTIKIINLSTKYTTSELKALVDLAESKIKDRKSNVIGIQYDVGAATGKPITGMPFNQHKVLISKDQIESTLSTIRKFLEEDECVKSREPEESNRQEYINFEMGRFREWLENGADATTQVQACDTTRVVFNGSPTEQSYEDSMTTWVHEFYHAFQLDIALEPPKVDSWCDDEGRDKSGWFIEAAADYFTSYVWAEYKPTGLTGFDRILKYGLQSFNETGPGLYDGGIARTGAAALLLLVERGAVKHVNIIDGTLFHKCERVSVYHDDNPEVKIAKSSWSEIQYYNGKYSFKPSVLNK